MKHKVKDVEVENNSTEISENNGISQILGNKAKSGIAVIILLLVISGVCALCGQINTSQVGLAVRFSEISNGNNPDKTPFNIQEILSEDVLERASEKLKGRVKVEDLRKHLTIASNTSGSDIEKVDSNIKEGNSEYRLFPSSYTLKYSVVSDKIKADGWLSRIGAVFSQIIKPGKSKILYAVADSYNEYYNEKYIQKGNVLSVDWSKNEDLDYYNKAVTTKSIADRITTFLSEKYNENAEFESEKFGIGYGELSSELKAIIDVDIENYKSYIIQNGITKDKDALLRQFTDMKAESEETNLRQSAKFSILQGAIDFYDSDVTKVVFIPALDNNDSFYMNRTKVGMDYLVEKASDAKMAADNAEHTALNYEYLGNMFSKVSVVDPAALVQADKMYEDIITKVDTFTAKASEIIEEENEDQSRMEIKTGKAQNGTGFVGMAKSSAFIFARLVIIAYVLWVLADLLKNKITDKKSEGVKEC